MKIAQNYLAYGRCCSKAFYIEKYYENVNKTKEIQFKQLHYDVLMEKLSIKNSKMYLYLMELYYKLKYEAFYEGCKGVLKFNVSVYENCFNYKTSFNEILNRIHEYKELSEPDKLRRSIESIFERKLNEYNFKDTSVVGRIIDFFNDLIKLESNDCQNYEEIFEAPILIFCLTHKYSISEEFKIQVKKAKRINKLIIFVKLEDDASIEHVPIDSLVYDISKYQKLKYQCHEMRNLLNYIQNYLKKDLRVNEIKQFFAFKDILKTI